MVKEVLFQLGVLRGEKSVERFGRGGIMRRSAENKILATEWKTKIQKKKNSKISFQSSYYNLLEELWCHLKKFNTGEESLESRGHY